MLRLTVTIFLLNLLDENVDGFILASQVPHRMENRVDYDPAPYNPIVLSQLLQIPRLTIVPVKRDNKPEKSRERQNVEGHMIKQPLLKFDMVWRRFSGHKRFSNAL
ncbi:unnamed protein product [Bursaphelenchus xylophilus]|nr:unnamed protein product [Bursaphelenchus xylophilus]CAG9106889.1 unnamed protein product [Bursaphelenchus xylophilus]